MIVEVERQSDAQMAHNVKTMYLNLIEEQLVEVVNLAIHKFDKR